jgi:phage-related protein
LVEKLIVFLGDSKEVLRKFPTDVRQEIGYALWELQQGRIPVIAKPFGKSIFELRDESKQGGTFRVAYVLVVKGTVHVLHAFQKKSQRTSRLDIAVIEARLKTLMRSLR